MPQIAQGTTGVCILRRRTDNGSGVGAASGTYQVDGASSTDRILLATMIDPNDPLNKSYYPAINTSPDLTGFIKDGRTPAITIRAIMKPLASAGVGWFDASLLLSLLNNGTGSGNYSDEHLVGWKDSAGTTRWYDYCRLAAMSMTQSAQGGPIEVTMTFLAQVTSDMNSTGYTALGRTRPTVSLPSTIQFGQTAGRGSTLFNSGLSDVNQWSLTFMREAAHDFIFQTTYVSESSDSPIEVMSRNLRGTLSTVQKSTAGTLITDNGTITMYLNADKAIGTGCTSIILKVEQDHLQTPVDPGSVYTRSSFTFMDRTDGTGAITIAASAPP